MRITPLQIIQYAAYLILLAIAGALEYFNLLPKNSTASVFLLVVGHFFGNTPMTAALVQNTQATRENTQTTAAGNAASNTIQPPTGPIHMVHHYEQPPPPLSPPAPATESIPEAPTGPIPVVSLAMAAAALAPVTHGPINFGETAKVPLVQEVQP